MISENHDHLMRRAIAAALDCERACNLCVSASLEDQSLDQLRECIRLELDCVEICALAAHHMMRESRFYVQACQLCAEICDACAAECEIHAHLEHCRRCAEACRNCAQAARAAALGAAVGA